ncbi:S1 family peptidase [Amycolatopsis samaneae]|uniref:S1 family peptidase n=1 Tax=Amycolatopsis samaneae TaxID=664691 RepID=A0ABW5GK45_9PSEU
MRVRAVFSAGILALGCATAGLATASPAAAVANGSDVPQGQYEFAAKLTLTGVPQPGGGTYGSVCSGSLVAPKWVLTTGHCFHDVNHNRVAGPVPYPTTATLGTSDQTAKPGETRKVTQVLQAGPNDVALAELDQPVTGITPLTVNRAIPAAGQRLTLAGWGSLTAVNPKPSTKLQQGVVEVGQVWPTTVGVHGVSPANTTSACAYDSGAPYFLPSGAGGQLVAVESNGPDCPHSGLETAARVDLIADWITSHIG